jgi:hypothetical protein
MGSDPRSLQHRLRMSGSCDGKRLGQYFCTRPFFLLENAPAMGSRFHWFSAPQRLKVLPLSGDLTRLNVDASPLKKWQMCLKRLLNVHCDFMASLYCCLRLNSHRDFSEQTMSQPARANFRDPYAFNVASGMFQFIYELWVNAVQCSH